jgi:hypothetical protein
VQPAGDGGGGGGSTGAGGGDGAGGSEIVTVSGAVMVAATSSGELRTASANPAAKAALETASITAVANAVPATVPLLMSAMVAEMLSHESPHATTYWMESVDEPPAAWVRRRDAMEAATGWPPKPVFSRAETSPVVSQCWVTLHSHELVSGVARGG